MSGTGEIRIGTVIRLRFKKGNPNNCTMHVRGFVDGQVIVRQWSRRWQSWQYRALEPYYFSAFKEHLRISNPKS